MEANVYKALQDTSTITELAAMTLYGISVSWPYLLVAAVRGDRVRNLLDSDIIELHRKIPGFCDAIAADPTLLLDGKSWMNHQAIMAICILSAELPELNSAIPTMFSGSAVGWRRFTQEFLVGGPFDSLSAEQRSRIFIPATNEGALGSWHVNQRYSPNVTAASFSNKIRFERNNTEQFIEKHCTHEDQQHVMRLIGVQGASGDNARFRRHLLEAQQNRAWVNRQRKEEAECKKHEEIQRVTSVGLVERPTQDSSTIHW